MGRAKRRWRRTGLLFLIFLLVVSGYLLYSNVIFRPDHKGVKKRAISPPEKQEERIANRGKVAIVVDDLGSNISEAKAFLKMDAPFTFAILPSAPFSRSIARKAAAMNREVIVHLPMEPWKFPEDYERDGVLLLEMGDRDLIDTVSREISMVPEAKGVSNHMGSKFTEDAYRMRIVLNECRRRGLYFLDSKTTNRSKAYKIAEELNVKFAVRDVFIDHERDTGFIKKQLDLLSDIAIKKGKAVGICHPYPETISVLRQYIKKFKENGIKIVSLSEIVQ